MNRFKIIAFVFIFMLIASCSKEERGGGPHIILNKDALTLSVGSEERLEIVVRSGGQVENPVWASTSPDVASVDMAGRVKGLKAGQATILVAAGKLSAVCTVTVKHGGNVRDVYVAGYETIDEINVATLWKNGEPIRLSDGTGNAEARSVYVAGDDVYVAGYMIFGSNPIAVVWKNGTAVPLSTRSSNAGSVYVNGGLVYVAGEEFIKAYTASLWRDGTLAMLSDRYSSAKSVYADGNNIYVGGTEYGVGGRIWKNGQVMPLSYPAGTGSSEINSVRAAGSAVYAAGSAYITGKNNVAVYWKNGNPVMLTDGAVRAGAEAVYIAGSDIYVAGYDTYEPGRIIATLWHNGAAISLSDNHNTAYAWDVTVSGEEVYVAGYERLGGKYQVATLWKDGVPVRLAAADRNSQALSVFVAE